MNAGAMSFPNSPNLQALFVVVFVIISVIVGSEVPRPRGVSLSRASLYSPSRNFVCFDNSKTIPFSQVNDDYCDCDDGSDEPGTSACPQGTFHCTNAGHKPVNLVSGRVNDGICDCCDGSDEYSHKSHCSNVCLQLGRHAREEAVRLAEVIKTGKQLKTELSQKGLQLKQEKKSKVGTLEKNKEEAEKILAEKQALKDEIELLENRVLEEYRLLESAEKTRYAQRQLHESKEEAKTSFLMMDSNGDAAVSFTELQTRKMFDTNNDGEVSEEEAKSYLNNQAYVDFENYVNDVWPNIKSLMIKEGGIYLPPSDESADSEAEDLHGEEEEHENAQDEEEEEEEEEPYNGPQPRDKASYLTYDEQTKKVVDQATLARNEFADAEQAVRDIDSEIKSIKEFMELEFGTDEEFASLRGECFEYTDYEYIYKLCMFEHTSQTPKSGGSDVRLGTWGSWAGPEDNKFESMLYDKGQACWNGPQRITKVQLFCGIENVLTAVSEPNRCEYSFEFTTPAACRDLSSDNDELHDEL